MSLGVKKTGVFSWQELSNCKGVPSEERLEAGPVAYIECAQMIPCNPCEDSCPFDAIKVGDSITNLPQLFADKCTGCGKCLPACPGLAIFRIHKNYTETTSLVDFPFEYYPLPQQGTEVKCVNREGKLITQGKVIKVKNPPGHDKTPIISIEVPKEHCLEVRSILRTGGE